MTVKSSLSRRDFLKLALLSGEGLIALPVLQACDRARSTSIPTAAATTTPSISTLAPAVTTVTTETPVPLTEGLEGLEFDRFLEESAKRLFLRDPEEITYRGVNDILGVGNDRLTDVSDSYIGETQKLQRGILDLLRRYDRASLSSSQVLYENVYEWYLDDVVRGFPFMYDDYLVVPFVNGLNYLLRDLFIDVHPFNNSQDLQDYIARLNQVGVKLEQVIAGLKLRQDFGVILPRIIFPALLAELKEYTGNAEFHPFFNRFYAKTAAMSGISMGDKDQWLSRARQAISETVIPAYQSLSEYFTGLQASAPNDIGVWRFSNGEQYYAHRLRHHTTTDLTADQIHQLGLDHVDRIHEEMKEAFSMLEYPSGDSLSMLMARLGAETGYVSGNDAVSRYQRAIDFAVGSLAKVFDNPLTIPIQVIGAKEGNYFLPPPRDGSRPPVFKALVYYDQPVFNIKTTAFHEAVPGHGYQFDVASQFNPPLFRELIQYDGYIEGWALYAEHLMWERGAYEDDPAGNLGRLHAKLRRAVRCVIDTGIHAKQWSYAQAVEYWRKTMGEEGEGEVRRYIMYPAQATAYYIGYLKVLELRQKAIVALGSKYDTKQFHRILLNSGQVPLALLEHQVNSWIGE